MAVFNPDVPNVQTPSYLRDSQPISSYEGDKTGGVALAGLGNLVTEGGKALNTYVEDQIDQKVYKGVDARREAFTGALEARGGVPGEDRVADYTPDASLVAQATGQKVPSAVVAAGDQIENLNQAMQGGKVTPTYYTGRLDLLAKDIRTQYPGWRDYIDKRIEAVTGENPANAYYKHLITDINAAGGEQKTQREHAITFMGAKMGEEGAPAIMQGLFNGMPPVNAYLWAAKSESKKAALTSAELELKVWKGTDEQKKAFATKAFTEQTSTAFNDVMEPVKSMTGITQDKWQNITDQAMAGTLKMDETQGAKIGQAMQMARDTSYNLKWAKMQNLIAVIGAPAAKEILDKQYGPMDNTIQLIQNKQYGLAFSNANYVEHAVNDRSKELFDNVDKPATATEPARDGTSEYVRNMASIAKHGGPQAAQQFLVNSIGKGLTPAMVQFAKDQKSKLAAQPDLPGNPATVKGIIENLQSKNIGKPRAGVDQGTADKEKEVFNSLTTFPSEVLLNPKIDDTSKKNVALGTYGPGNENIIAKFDKDSRDPSKGFFIPGTHTIFNRLYNPDVTNEMFRLGRQDPQYWNMYKTTAVNEFGNNIFKSDILDLNEIQKSPNVQISYSTIDHGWRADPVAFSDKKGSQTGYGTAKIEADNINAKLEQLNLGIRSMAEIYKKDGKDPNAEVLRFMVGIGLDPTKAGIPADMMKALTTSAADPFKTKDTSKDQSRVGAP